MKTVLNYYLKRKKGTEREIEHNSYVIILAIGMFIGLILSEYIHTFYWAVFLIVYLPMCFNHQYEKIIELERKERFSKYEQSKKSN